MTIMDPGIAALLSLQPAPELAPVAAIPVAERRDALEIGFAAMIGALPPGPIFDDVDIVETTVPGPDRDIPIRIFRPRGVKDDLPALLFFFGGGFWMRTYNSPDNIGACRQTASQAQAVVVEIDYALAPEHPYPAAHLEGRAVLEWMATGAGEHRIDPARLAVGGQSAGGGLAAGLALWARDEGGPSIALQVLEVPGVDVSLDQFDPMPEGYAADEIAGLVECLNFYLPDGIPPRDQIAAPLRADTLVGLPPAFIVTAEHDYLRGMGDAYAARLRDAGVPVVSVAYGGQVHISPALAGISPGARAWRAQAAWAVGTLHNPGEALS